MKLISFGNIADALEAGKRAEAKISTGPVPFAPAQFAALQFSSSDFVNAAISNSSKKLPEFVWTSDIWGSKQFKVSD